MAISLSTDPQVNYMVLIYCTVMTFNFTTGSAQQRKHTQLSRDNCPLVFTLSHSLLHANSLYLSRLTVLSIFHTQTQLLSHHVLQASSILSCCLTACLSHGAEDHLPLT